MNQMETNSAISIVTDSVAQVPEEIARQLKITVLPFSVNFGGKPIWMEST